MKDRDIVLDAVENCWNLVPRTLVIVLVATMEIDGDGKTR